MTVACVCTDCDDEHPLGDRPGDENTAASCVCPVCGSTSFYSECRTGGIDKSEAARIRDAVEPVDGVGEQTCQNIVSAFSYYAELETTTATELTAIDNVGAGTASKIIDRLGNGDSQ